MVVTVITCAAGIIYGMPPWEVISAFQLSYLGLTAADLDGTYFSHHCYSVEDNGTITCTPSKTRAAKGLIAGVKLWGPITMDANGNVTGI